MDDLISRAAGINALNRCTEIYLNNLPPTIFKKDAVEAIKVLPPAQPGCEDAVSRADVDLLIEEVQTAWLKGDILLMYPALKKGLQKVPPVTPKQPGWIPCSKKLPEEPFACLVTVWDTNPVTMDEFENVLPYFVGWDGEQWNDADGEQCPFEVIAWMPLPTPYREGGQDE